MKRAHITGASLGLLHCSVCHLLVSPLAGEPRSDCPRCGEPLHSRKPNSVAKSWAFLIAAMILYIPANLYPVMTSHSIADAQSDTIFSGILALYESGSWPLAVVVFVASFAVPLAKIAGLSLLLVSVQRRSTRAMQERTRLFQLIERIGRWSMLDMFVVTLVVSMVQLEPLMWVTPNIGAAFFGAVVALTMLAAQSFDPRLIWDAIEDDDA